MVREGFRSEWASQGSDGYHRYAILVGGLRRPAVRSSDRSSRCIVGPHHFPGRSDWHRRPDPAGIRYVGLGLPGGFSDTGVVVWYACFLCAAKARHRLNNSATEGKYCGNGEVIHFDIPQHNFGS